MSDDQPKRKRRRRRRGKGGGGQPPSPPQPKPIDPYDVQAETADIKREQQEQKRLEQSAAQLIEQLLPLILQARDLEVLAWLIKATGTTEVSIVTQILRAAIVRERRAFIEAHGGGGASSTNLEALAARIG